MSHVDTLFRLQQIDTEIREKKQRLGQVIQAQKESPALLAARQRAETAAAELRTWEVRQQDLDLELKSLRTKLKNSENRLYSGSVKNPKELADLQGSIEAMGRQRSSLEDEVLEAMIMVEDAQEEDGAAAAHLSEVQSKWEREQSSLAQEKVELAQRINALTGARQEQLALVPGNLMQAYDRAVQRGRGVGVVAIRNGRCLGCQVSLPENQIRAASEGKLVQCDSCARILCPV